MVEYTLAVLTHGHGDTLDQALASFYDKVRPLPTQVLVHSDAGHSDPPAAPGGFAADVERSVEQRGFCRATAHLWRWASERNTEHVFWLEHDFTFLRPVDLQPLAYVLDQNADICQMQLMRTPVSQPEIAAGGLFESRPGEYALKSDYAQPVAHTWLRHRCYFTTNPSLMRTEFMAAHPWPDDGQSECEGRFGIKLVQDGFSFGVWGAGEPWVEHIGQRTGFGY